MFGIKYAKLKYNNLFVRSGVFSILIIIVLALTLMKNITITISFINDNYLITFIIMTVTSLLFILFIKHLIRIYKIFSINNSTLKTNSCLLYLLFSILAMIVFHLIVAFTIQSNGLNSFTNTNLDFVTVIIMCIFYIIFSPILEELIIRGIFLNIFFQQPGVWLKKMFGPSKSSKVFNIFLAILVSSFIYTILHNAIDPLAIMNYMFNGIILSILYLKTKNILVCIGYHVINNIIAFIPIIVSIF